MLIDNDFAFSETKPDSPEKVSFNDELLWSYIKDDNELAFAILYKRHVGRLFTYGMHCCKRQDLVKDCVHQLFVKIWSDRNTLNVSGSFNHYLFKSFRRLLVERLKASRRPRFLFQRTSGSFNFTPLADALINHTGTENHQWKIPSALYGLLDEKQSEAIFLKFFNGLSYDEISSVMDLHDNSAYDLISNALDILREELKSLSPLNIFCKVQGFPGLT